MARVKKKILSVLYSLKYRVSLSKLLLGKKLGLIRSVMIMPYQGFGNEKKLFFLGRVLRDRGIGISQLEDSKWRNFKKMYKRFMTWKIPEAAVEASFNGVTKSATTDEEGYFEFRMVLPHPIRGNNPWHKIRLELLDEVVKNQKPPVVYCNVFVPPENVEFGVISDIDDTIVPTGATRMWEMLKTTFLGNAQTRVPFPGVAAFYQALSKGLVGHENNPFFYVSSSPWNLYDFLRELMDIHNLPQGPLMLRDIGLSREYFFAGSHTEHKLVQIERIFDIIGNIPFILIGDSGQHDAEIYLQVIRDFPGRVKMVYIRDVDPGSHKKVLKIAEEIGKLGVEMMLLTDTIEAAHHAVSKGWILEGDIVLISEEKKEDEGITGSLLNLVPNKSNRTESY
jgi:phosphatidate phosphatase APP1